jgi:hypothetical protein
MTATQESRIEAEPPALGFAASSGASLINPAEFRTHEVEGGRVANVLIVDVTRKK